MCEANVYMLGKDGEEKLILESVDKVIPSGDEIFIENIFSQRKTLRGKIKEMALVDHRIVLEEI